MMDHSLSEDDGGLTGDSFGRKVPEPELAGIFSDNQKIRLLASLPVDRLKEEVKELCSIHFRLVESTTEGVFSVDGPLPGREARDTARRFDLERFLRVIDQEQNHEAVLALGKQLVAANRARLQMVSWVEGLKPINGYATPSDPESDQGHDTSDVTELLDLALTLDPDSKRGGEIFEQLITAIALKNKEKDSLILNNPDQPTVQDQYVNTARNQVAGFTVGRINKLMAAGIVLRRVSEAVERVRMMKDEAHPADSYEADT